MAALDNDWGQFVMIDVHQTSVSTNAKRFKPVLDPLFEYNDNGNVKTFNQIQVPPHMTEPIHYQIAFSLVQNIYWLFSQSMFHIEQKILLFCNKKQK